MSDTCRNIAFYNDVFTRREFNNKIENVFEQHLVFFNYDRYFANFPINATFLPVYDFQKLSLANSLKHRLKSASTLQAC